MKVLYGMTLLAGASLLAFCGPTQARPPAISPNGDVEAFNVTVINNSTDFVFGGFYLVAKDPSNPTTDTLTIDPSTFDFNRSGIIGPGQKGSTQIFFTASQFNGGLYNVDLFSNPTSDLNPANVQFTVPLTVELDADSACEGPSKPSYCTNSSTLPDVTIPAAAPSSVPEAGGLIPFGLGALGLGFLTLKAHKRKEA